MASETHLKFSRTCSIEDSYIKVSDENDEHRDQEPWKKDGDKDERSKDRRKWWSEHAKPVC